MYSYALSSTLMYPHKLPCTVPSSTLMYPPQFLCTQMYSHVWGCTLSHVPPTTLRYPNVLLYTLINSHVPSSIIMYPNVLSCMGMYSTLMYPNNSQVPFINSRVPSSTLLYPNVLMCTIINTQVPSSTLMRPSRTLTYTMYCHQLSSSTLSINPVMFSSSLIII